MKYLRIRTIRPSMRSLLAMLLILAVVVAAVGGVSRAAPRNQTSGSDGGGRL